MDLIDTHQHLIYRQRLGYAWTNDFPALASRDFTAESYARLVEGLGIAATLFMETGVDDSDYQAEARFVAGLVGQNGIAGQIASCRPEQEAGFDAWLDECDGLQVKGFRRILHVMPDELSREPMFRANIAKVGKRDLPFDICVLARQLPLATELASACDEQIFVLDHCGVPDIAGDQFESWARDIAIIARLPNVFCKLSGLTAYCAAGKSSAEKLAPWFDHVAEKFGPARIIWGGDWPVVELGSGLPEWIKLSRCLLSRLPVAEAKAIASGNALQLYNL